MSEMTATLLVLLIVTLFMLLPLVALSVILFLTYKVLRIRYKKPKYAHSRYKYILWRLIFVKSTILAPVVWWVFDTIGRVTGSSSLPSGLWGFTVAWFIWCGIIFTYRTLRRKFYRKSPDGVQKKLPSTFYNKKQ